MERQIARLYAMRKSSHVILSAVSRVCFAAVMLGIATLAPAQQTNSPAPYDSIGAEGVKYAGPGREAAYDLRGPAIHIGLVVPLQGPEKADGEAIVRAARMALQDESGRPLPGGIHLALSEVDESVPPWGALGDEIIHLVIDEKALAIVTCADGVAAHLSEQIGNKIGVPILTLSSDPTTTQISLPWIFRLGPSDAQQARIIAREIYHVRGFTRVLLVTESDHNGRIGGREFTEAARQLGVPAPESMVLNPLQPDVNSFLGALRSKPPQAVVLWTLPENARKLLDAMRREKIDPAVYLSQEVAQAESGVGLSSPDPAAAANAIPGEDIYTVASAQRESPSAQNFAQRYLQAAGTLPSPVAAEAYDAIRLIASAVREAGPNRARVRDRILSAHDLSGVSGEISFDEQGNNKAGVGVVRVRER